VQRALARREPPRAVDPAYRFGPADTGPPAHAAAAAPDGAGPPARRRPSAATLRRALEQRGEQAFKAYVKRSDDRRLERTAGSRAGLRVLFAAMATQYVPERAAGFEGDIRYELRGADGSVRAWTVSITPERATARPGAAPDPKLVLKLSLADFLRIAGGDLDPGKALLTGRMDLQGDFSVALRLGEMFGQPSAF
jgi:putative sterol carrier protein